MHTTPHSTENLETDKNTFHQIQNRICGEKHRQIIQDREWMQNLNHLEAEDFNPIKHTEITSIIVTEVPQTEEILNIMIEVIQEHLEILQLILKPHLWKIPMI